MLTQQWQTGLLVGLLVAHLLVTYGLYRMRSDGDTAADEDAGTADSGGGAPEEGVVACRTCGAENDLGYRFCRSCVEELPGAASFDRTGVSPFRRTTR